MKDIKEAIQFFRRINLDDPLENFEKGDMTFAKNIVIYKNVGTNETFAQNLRSTLLLNTANYFKSTQTCIGIIRNEINNGLFIFICDTPVSGAAEHEILYFNGTDNSLSLVIGGDNTNLNFNKNASINGIYFQNNLIWSDGVESFSNPPRHLDLGGTTLSERVNANQLNLIKTPPPILNVTVNTTSTINTNFNYKCYQFSSRFIYKNGMKSKASFVTELVIMENYISVSSNLYPSSITLTQSIPDISLSNTIEYVEFIVRDRYTFGFKHIAKVPYPTSGTNVALTFLDSGTYSIIPPEEIDVWYDAVPLKSKTTIGVQNRVLLGNNLEGQNEITDLIDTVITNTQTNQQVIRKIFKPNSSYKLAITLYDKEQRSILPYSNESLNLQTIAQTGNNIPATYLSFPFKNSSINNTWVNNYSIDISENLDVTRFIQARAENILYCTGHDSNNNPIFTAPIQSSFLAGTTASTGQTNNEKNAFALSVYYQNQYNYKAHPNTVTDAEQSPEIYVDVNNFTTNDNAIGYTWNDGDRLTFLTQGLSDVSCNIDKKIKRQEGRFLVVDGDASFLLQNKTNIYTFTINGIKWDICCVKNGNIFLVNTNTNAVTNIFYNSSYSFNSIYVSPAQYNNTKYFVAVGDSGIIINGFITFDGSGAYVSNIYSKADNTNTDDLFCVAINTSTDGSNSNASDGSNHIIIIGGDNGFLYNCQIAANQNTYLIGAPYTWSGASNNLASTSGINSYSLYQFTSVDTYASGQFNVALDVGGDINNGGINRTIRPFVVGANNTQGLDNAFLFYIPTNSPALNATYNRSLARSTWGTIKDVSVIEYYGKSPSNDDNDDGNAILIAITGTSSSNDNYLQFIQFHDTEINGSGSSYYASDTMGGGSADSGAAGRIGTINGNITSIKLSDEGLLKYYENNYSSQIGCQLGTDTGAVYLRNVYGRAHHQNDGWKGWASCSYPTDSRANDVNDGGNGISVTGAMANDEGVFNNGCAFGQIYQLVGQQGVINFNDRYQLACKNFYGIFKSVGDQSSNVQTPIGFSSTISSIVPLNYGCLIEIYTPKKPNEQNLIYKSILSTGISMDSTLTPIPSKYVTNPNSNVDSTINVGKDNEGDCFLIQKTFYGRLWSKGTWIVSMTPHPTDISGTYRNQNDDNSQDFGWVKGNVRPSVIAIEKQIQKNFTTGLRWSLPFLEDTQINALNTFNLTDNKTLPYENGAISKLELATDVAKEGGVVLAAAEFNNMSLYIGRNLLTAPSGNDILATSSDFIGSVQVLSGNHGSTHLDSVKRYQNLVFGFDVNKGNVWQYSEGGCISITDTKSKVFRYFKLKSKQFLQYKYDSNYKIVSFINPYRREYVICFPAISGVTAAESFAYNFDLNAWVTYYDYYPDRVSYIGNRTIAFNNNLWEHEAGSDFNNLYGTTYDAYIVSGINEEPIAQKTFLTHHSLGDLMYASEFRSKKSNYDDQYCNMIPLDYKKQFGFQSAGLWRNMNITGTAQEQKLAQINGEALWGNTALVTLNFENNTQQQTCKLIKVGYY
jgi:hypothetical protein